jgi:hypothetical protein
MILNRRSLLMLSVTASALAGSFAIPLSSAIAAPTHAKEKIAMNSHLVAHRYATINGHKIFYRECVSPFRRELYDTSIGLDCDLSRKSGRPAHCGHRTAQHGVFCFG